MRKLHLQKLGLKTAVRFFAILLLSISQLKAQTDITIGTGVVGNTGTTYPAPLQDFYEGSRAQYLYTAAELNAAGMTVGNISAIKFNVTGLNTFAGVIEAYTIKIGTGTVGTLNLTTWETVSNNVYGPVDYVPTVGVNSFTFTSPFFWNGVDNIIVEICNGGAAYTNNASTPWTEGLSFNGSHTYRADGLGNLCGTATVTNTGTATNRPNIVFAWASAVTCSGAPLGGTATSSSTSITCPGASFTLGLTGSTSASGLTYQWQSSPDNITFTNISGATSLGFTTTQTAPTLYYRCVVRCTPSSLSSNSTSILVNSVSSPIYANLPYSESFENTWINSCNSKDVPNSSWKNTPATGNQSWRRDDDGTSAGWTSVLGAYTPTSTQGSFSARFHSYNAPNASTGNFDLYLNCNTTPTGVKRLRFDYTNASGPDSLTILVSTNGGVTFVRVDSINIAATWRTKTVFFNSNSATTIVRFRGTSDDGTTDIGLDNVTVNNFADCAGAPVGGTANASPLAVCLGDPISLSLTGATDGNGISYQWQVSTNNVTFTDVPGATNFTFNTSQTLTSYYRCRVTCSFGSLSSNSTTVTVASPLLVGGTYTINKTLPTNFPTGTNFASFNDAYNAIKCGISSPVIFNVVTGTGPYNEQLIIDRYIGGSSPTNTITFNGNGNTLSFASANTNERAVVKLKSTNWFIFDNLVVNAAAGTFGYGFHLMTDADSNTIRNCTIITSTTATTANFAGVVISGSNTDPIGTGLTLCDANIIQNNTITGGLYGVTLTATFTGGANGFNEIRKNNIRDFLQNGIHVAASYNTVIDSNTISRPTRTTTADVNGIFFTTQSNNCFISRNTITKPYSATLSSTNTFNGINFSTASASSGNDNFVVNNLIANLNGAGAQNGILNTASSNLLFIHNTISLDDATSTSTSTTRGYSQSGASASVLFFNNLITIGRGGTGTKHCMNVAALPTFADNNLYFINAPAGSNHIGFFTSNRTTLANWKTAFPGQELFSLSINPIFTDPLLGNFAPANGAIDDRGLYLGIDNDILGAVRNGATPDIGAYEFVPPPCSIPPVNGITLVSASTICQNQPVQLSLNIGGFGSGQTFQWQYATNIAGPYTNLSSAPSKFFDTTILSTQTYYYRCAIKCLTSTVFTNEVLLTVNPAFPTGVYTINNTLPLTYVTGVTGGNFPSFNGAYTAMLNCGVVGAGNIIFNVAAGPYNEQLIIDSIAGVNASRQVIFNGNGKTIAFSSVNANEKAVIKLRKADYFTFDSLVIDATGAGTNGFGIQLINNADSNTIRNCVINTNGTSTSQNYAGIVVNATEAGTIATGLTLCDGNIFDKNIINGGWCGISLVGGTGAVQLINNNKITRNRILDFYTHGIYIAGSANTLIDSNFISRPTRVIVTAGNAINFTGSSSIRSQVSNNRITRLFGGAPTNASGFFAIIHNNVDATSGSENRVFNNAIYNTDGAGLVFGLYNAGSNYVRYYHNTISIDNPSSTSTSNATGFFQTTAALGLDFKNNIISITRGGTGAKYCINMATNTSELSSNWNNFFINAGGTNNHIGFITTNRTTLASWSAVGNRDSLSLNFDPIYLDSANGNFQPQMFPLNNKGTNLNIATDINGVARNATTPDMGAWEFTPPACALPILGGTASVTPNTGACLEIPIRLTLAGNSPIGQVSFQWQHATSATGPWNNVGPALFAPTLDTVSTTNNFYQCIVTCLTSGVTSTSTVTSISLNPIMAGGTYTINPGLPLSYPGPPGSNFQTMQQAVNALLCGITGSVIFNVDGTFTEQIRMPNIPGTNASRTVTFQSATGSPANANLRFNPTVATQNYVLSFDSCRYVIFKNMTILNQSTTIGRAVTFGLGASFDSLLNCTVVGANTTSTTNTMATVFLQNTTATSNINNIVIKGNTVNNGSMGIFYSGFSNVALASPTNQIEGNTVNGSYNTGIQAQFSKALRLTSNTINLTSVLGPNGNGIFTDFLDSASNISSNTININGVTTSVTGLFIRNSRAAATNPTIVRSNRVIAANANTGNVYGITLALNNGLKFINNTSTISSAGTIAYALHALTNATNIDYYNNSFQVSSASTSGYAAYFSQAVTGNFKVNNNIFSNTGGGVALFVTNPAFFTADYNMLFSSGANLIQISTPTVTNFANLANWISAWNWDRSSIVYRPAFLSNTDLRPDIASPNSWAMNGRGLQTKGNNFDFNNAYRPDSLTAGVPDMGAYEFYPTALPTVLTATPATPIANSLQTFMYGSDTVMKIRWAATVPPSVEVRRFSGDVPKGLTRPRSDSMFFYTKVEVPGAISYSYDAQLFYVESFLGSIPNQGLLGMGRTTPSNAWVVGFNSQIDVAKKRISQNSIAYLDRFTGLVNVSATPISEDSTSNRGKDFWVGYQRSNGFTGANGGSQDMVLYLGTGAVAATVTVTIEGTSGTPWVRTYTVPPNQAITSDPIPKNGADDARLVNDGVYRKKGIHITSNVPVVAYAHIFESTNSGATMLLPTSVWGYEHYVLTSRQNYSNASYSAFHIVAQTDSTWVEINPAANTQGGWTPNGGPFGGKYLVKLNKGDAYQVLGVILSGSEGVDLTGSFVKSIANAQGFCHPITVFSGSTRTGIGCGTSAGGSGDLIIQQIFPYQAWGTKFLTAPSSTDVGPNASSNMTNKFRVLVKDPTTVVKRNNVVLTGIIGNRYYEYESSTADYIETNKPSLVAQYMSSSGSCPNTGGDGDPEMFYLSPLEQSVKQSQFYRNNRTSIDNNFITLVIPNSGLTSLKIDGISYLGYPLAERFVYPHSQPGFSVVTKRWSAIGAGGFGSSTVESDEPFTGIVYGLGSVESYGYNLGTLVKNLNNLSSVNNTLNTSLAPTEYTCKGSTFRVNILLPLVPDSIRWKFSALPFMSPRVDSVIRNPGAGPIVTVNGVQFYSYTVNQDFVIDSAGSFRIPIEYWSPEIESCDKRRNGFAAIQVLPPPLTDYKITYPGGGLTGCEGDNVSFVGDVVTQNGIALNQWNWTFASAGTTPSGQNQSLTFATSGTFPVKLRGITADGCISDTTKNVVINIKPVVNVATPTVAACPGTATSVSVASPSTTVVYNWYSAATGGTLVGTGSTLNIASAVIGTSYFVEGLANGCNSLVRSQVTITQLPLLNTPVVTVTGQTINTVSFAWAAVSGANSYEVSVNGGAFITPSGATSHVVSGLNTLQSVNIIVRALGSGVCQTSTSLSVSGCTNYVPEVVPDSLATCATVGVTFNVNPVIAGVNYRWYTTPVGGTAVNTGNSFATSSAASTAYFVEGNAATCTSLSRKRVKLEVFNLLAKPIVVGDSTHPTILTWTWTAVPSAQSYQVSLDGVLWTTPSSGSTGLTHVIPGQLPATTKTLFVRAVGILPCQNNESVAVISRTVIDQLFIPNVFTPNGDGRNDVLRIYGYVIKDLHFMVYNQWGEKVFETRSQAVAWDGTFKGQPLPVGVYAYICKMNLIDGKSKDLKGMISIIR